MQKLFLISLIFSLALSFSANAKPVLHSSVPPEFANGLHSKYLAFLASQLNMELKLRPMPFARRLDALRRGDIDVMVGLQRADDVQDEVAYLYPSYEALRHTFFVLSTERHKLKNFEDLRQLDVGVTIHAKYFERFNQESALAMVGVSTLKQKIRLLENGRIDTFLHFKESTLPTLKNMQLSERIVLADYQPNEQANYYFALSTNSPFIKRREQFEQAISAGVKNGKFAEIRRQHYAKGNLNPKSE